jgi:adenylate cyclase
VVKRLVSRPELVELKGRDAHLTILFSDIRGFTSMSETMEPAQVSTLLNEYLGAMTRVIFEHGGTLDKFMGDAVMAFWGDPIPQPDHALRAVRAALEMRAKTEELVAEWQRQGRQPIAAGIGINTGRVVVGNLGSSDFVDYTVIGDDVNLACRLEQVARAGQILLSEATLKEVEGKVTVTALEPVTVKGRAEPVLVYELVGLIEGT